MPSRKVALREGIARATSCEGIMNTAEDPDASATLAAIAALTLAPLLWAGNFVVGRAMRLDVGPLELNALRWTIAAAVLVPVLLWHRAAVGRALRRRWAVLLLHATLGIVAFNALLYAGLARTPAATTGILFGTVPLMILVAARLTGGRAPTRREVAGAVVALAGVALVVREGGASEATTDLAGIAFILAAGLAWTGYTIATRALPLGVPPMPALAMQAATGALMMLPALPGAGTAAALARPETGAAVAYLALGASIGAFWLWLQGVGRLGVQRAGPFLNLIPVFAVVLGALLLGERPGAAQIAGLGLVVAGVAAAQLRG